MSAVIKVFKDAKNRVVETYHDVQFLLSSDKAPSDVNTDSNSNIIDSDTVRNITAIISDNSISSNNSESTNLLFNSPDYQQMPIPGGVIHFGDSNNPVQVDKLEQMLQQQQEELNLLRVQKQALADANGMLGKKYDDAIQTLALSAALRQVEFQSDSSSSRSASSTPSCLSSDEQIRREAQSQMRPDTITALEILSQQPSLVPAHSRANDIDQQCEQLRSKGGKCANPHKPGLIGPNGTRICTYHYDRLEFKLDELRAEDADNKSRKRKNKIGANDAARREKIADAGIAVLRDADLVAQARVVSVRKFEEMRTQKRARSESPPVPVSAQVAQQ